jgi:electron transfer flavoprotein beta subunit
VRTAVLVKSVPIGNGSLRVAGDRLARDGVVHGLDPVNPPALEWALRCREHGELAEVAAVNMGPPGARDALRAALAMGCDRAVHVLDDRLAGADLRRTIAVLAAAVRTLEAQLVLCGYESGDGSSGAVPAGLASALDWPLLTRVHDATLAAGELRATRDAGPARQHLAASTPAVLSFVEGELLPRHATLKDTIAARATRIEVVDLAALGGPPNIPGPAERTVALRAVEYTRPDPLVLDAVAGAEHVRALLAELTSEGARARSGV